MVTIIAVETLLALLLCMTVNTTVDRMHRILLLHHHSAEFAPSPNLTLRKELVSNTTISAVSV